MNTYNFCLRRNVLDRVPLKPSLDCRSDKSFARFKQMLPIFQENANYKYTNLTTRSHVNGRFRQVVGNMCYSFHFKYLFFQTMFNVTYNYF